MTDRLYCPAVPLRGIFNKKRANERRKQCISIFFSVAELPSHFLDNLLGTARRHSPGRTGGAMGAAAASSFDFPIAETQPAGDLDALPCKSVFF